MNAASQLSNRGKSGAALLSSGKRTIFVAIAALLIVSGGAAKPTYADAPAPDSIRVGLFLDVPKYKLNTAMASFSSAAPLSVGLREPSGTVPLFQAAAGQAVRFTLDDYKPKVIETPDFQTALTVFKRVKTLGGSPMLASLDQSDGKRYEVLEGSYATAAEASAAAAKWLGDGSIAGLSGKTAPELSGPLHYEAGSFATEADAAAAAKPFVDAGVDAFAAAKPDGNGGAAFVVLVGAAADEAALGLVMEKAAGPAGGQTLNRVDSSAGYVILRADYGVSESPDAPAKLCAVPMSGAKAWLSTAADSGIKLAERYSRSYRGGFEMSGVNGKLAVVNELPFEQYLYSVVGGEMPGSWPIEALKAQAVAARTYALFQSDGFQVAQVVDTTVSQAYGGIGAEKPTTIQAVDDTAGMIAVSAGKPIETVFSASAGGRTADASEIWGADVSYLKTVASPDESSEQGLYHWHRVVTPDGLVGYVREDLLEDTGQTNAAGKPIMRVKENGVRVRPIPLVQDDVAPVGTVDAGETVVELENVFQSNEMSWVRGPFAPDKLLSMLNARVKTKVGGPLSTLEIGKTGPSGRPTEILANGQQLDVGSPDSFRSAFGGLPGSLFTIDETARMTIAGSGDSLSERSGGPLAIMGGGQTVESAGQNMFIMNGSGAVRAATREPTFRFVGSGSGHGVGLSQYGARGLAESGYDYQYILKYYYKDAEIVKE